MPISKDLFLAILSMDAYNRGYGAGIANGGAEDPDGLGETGQIGSASIQQNAGILKDGDGNRLDNAAGFYAISYTLDEAVGDLATNTTVISYRGTDRYFV